MSWYTDLKGRLSSRFTTSAGETPASFLQRKSDLQTIADPIIKITKQNFFFDKTNTVAFAWHRLADSISYAFETAQKSGSDQVENFQKLYIAILDVADRLVTVPERHVFKNLQPENLDFLREHGYATLTNAYCFLRELPLDMSDLPPNVRIHSKNWVFAHFFPSVSPVLSHLKILSAYEPAIYKDGPELESDDMISNETSDDGQALNMPLKIL